MQTPATIKPSLTLLDGTTYYKEFPAFNQNKFKPTTLQPQNVYYDSLRPIFIVLTLTGTLPVLKLKTSNPKLEALLVGSMCFTVYVIFAYLTFLITRDVVHLIFHDEDFSSIIVQVTIMMLLIQHVFYIVLTWPESLAVNKYINEWGNFQECMVDISAEKLEDYRLVWMRLTEIVRSGSSMLSYTMALMVTTPFAYEVIAAYNLTMFVIRSIQQGSLGNTQEAIATFITFILYGYLLYMFCNSGHWMTLMCESIQDVLLAHKPRQSTALGKVNSEIRLFLRCLRSVPPHATLSGYVTINRKVFLHMTGVLVTYLIILVQFNIGSVNHNKAQVLK